MFDRSEVSRQLIDLALLDDIEKYKLLTGVVIPRPIALVSTLEPDGTPNLAPYSFFNVVAHEPPLIMISCARGAEAKDTARNIDRTGQFVVAVPSRELVNEVDVCGERFGPGDDEFVRSGLSPVPAHKVSPPLVDEAMVNLECVLRDKTVLPGGRYELIIGEVVVAHVASGIRNSRGHIDAVALDPLARLGGKRYSGIREPIAGRPAASQNSKVVSS